MYMRCVVFLAFILSRVNAGPVAHVVAIIGQSNSIGRNNEGHTDEDVAYPNIVQTSCCVNGGTNNDQCRFVEGQDPLHHQCDEAYLQSKNIGFGMTFARLLRAEIPEDDIIIVVPAGIGGTGFVDNVWTAYTGRGFVQALARLNSTFNLLKESYPNHTPQLAGYLWHQGEADADVNTTTDDYLNKDIIPMINAWRNSSLIPETSDQVPFVVGNLVPGWVLEPGQEKRLGVSIAIQLLAQYVPYSASTPSQGLLGESNSPIHFSSSSQRNFGKRYFVGFKSAQSNVPDQ